LVDGPSLAVRLRQGPLPADRCAALGAALADALAYVHRRGVVHRDVKPGNVLLGPGPRVRLADFGIAQLLDASTLTVTGTTLGTAAYMAPEQLAHHRVGPAADVWSLGAILLECLTGRRPYEGNAAEVVARRLAGTRPSCEGLPAPWRILLSSMVDDNPVARPEAAEVAELLASPAFARPWDPHATEAMAAAEMAATTVVAPHLAAAAARGPAATNVVLPDGPPTATATPTVVGASARAAAARRQPLSPLARAGIVAAVLFAIGLIVALTAGSGPAGRKAGATGTTTAPTTTTTASTAGAVSGTLVHDVQQGEAVGALSPAAGSAVLSQLGQALAFGAQGDAQQAAQQLGVMESTIFQAAATGQATPAEASTLMADVAALASAMNLPPPTTTTTTAPPPPAPHKPHHGG
ncbi:MAG TPA: serine/threonine-protein kinase, partial [Acidimicrobiales bacterium]|nr:serine/threonine-protein kinase [Acidimicrobiales bacterium]